MEFLSLLYPMHDLVEDDELRNTSYASSICSYVRHALEQNKLTRLGLYIHQVDATQQRRLNNP